MGVAYINPMTGQQVKVMSGSDKPAGFWTPIGEVPDCDCDNYISTTTIMQTSPIMSAVNDMNVAVGNDFTAEDDEF